VIDLSNRQKERLAGLVRQPLAAFILSMAVRILVSRHRTGVTLVCFNSQNRILMLRHVFRPSTPWDLPGGWLERNETPADCALRELREESARTGAFTSQYHVHGSAGVARCQGIAQR